MAVKTMVNTRSNLVNLYNRGLTPASPNFAGTVWINKLVSPLNGLNCSLGSVIFKPGARTNWHSHPGGQILIITKGKGYYQEQGEERRELHQGEVIVCMPNVIHWHGASESDSLVHIAFAMDADKGPVRWLQKVTYQEYLNEKQAP